MFSSNEKNTTSTILSHISGVLFSIAWWLFVDAVTQSSKHDYEVEVTFLNYLPGIAATLAFILLVSLEWENIRESGIFGDSGSRVQALSMLFGAAVCGFGSVLVSLYVMFVKYVQNKESDSSYPGVAMVIQTVLICISAILFRIARNKEEDD